MAESDCAASLSTLISKEDETSFNANEMCEDAPMSEVDGELVELLLSRERCYSSSRAHDSSPQNSKALKSARSDAIRWILKAKAFFGFGVKTVYVAVSYLDGFFEHRTVDFVVSASLS
ncbi:hypothetical protein Cni_G10375 [Canna indica]|uniref:Cyclin N-terminal domain-containing protein n=1 Tax=Canna indica TaxID=4628 RepID=A0AAQ3K6I2_9LILI|nr:hypothetical protein Cni_G10375 [Canna indica]